MNHSYTSATDTFQNGISPDRGRFNLGQTTSLTPLRDLENRHNNYSLKSTITQRHQDNKLEENLKGLYDRLISDDLLITLQEDKNCQQFVAVRVREIITDSLLIQKDFMIDNLVNQRNMLRLELSQRDLANEKERDNMNYYLEEESHQNKLYQEQMASEIQKRENLEKEIELTQRNLLENKENIENQLKFSQNLHLEQVSQYSSQINMLQNRLMESQREAQKCQERLHSTLQENEDIKRNIDNLQDQLQSLEYSMQVQQEKHHFDYEEKQQSLRQLNSLLSEQKGQIEKLNKDLNASSDFIQTLEREKDNLNQRLTIQNSENEKQISQLRTNSKEALEQAKHSAHQKNQVLQQKVKKYKQKSQELQQKLKLMKSGILEDKELHNRALEVIQDQLRSLEEQKALEFRQLQVNNQKALIYAEEKWSQIMDGVKQQHSRDIAGVKQQQESEVGHLNQQISKLDEYFKQTQEVMEQQLNQQINLNNEKDYIIQQLQRQKSQLETQIQSIARNFHNANEDSQHRLRESEKVNLSLGDQINKLQDESAQMASRIQFLQSEQAKLNQIVSKDNQQKQTLLAENKKIQIQLEEQKSQQNQLRDDIIDLERQIQGSRAEVSDIQQKNHFLVGQLDLKSTQCLVLSQAQMRLQHCLTLETEYQQTFMKRNRENEQSLTKKLNEKSSEIYRYMTEISDLERELKSQRQKNLELNEQCTMTRTQVTNKESEFVLLERKLAANTKQTEEFNRLYLEAAGREQSMESELQSKTDRLNHLENSELKLRQDNQNLWARLNESQSTIQTMKREICQTFLKYIQELKMEQNGIRETVQQTCRHFVLEVEKSISFIMKNVNELFHQSEQKVGDRARLIQELTIQLNEQREAREREFEMRMKMEFEVKKGVNSQSNSNLNAVDSQVLYQECEMLKESLRTAIQQRAMMNETLISLQRQCTQLRDRLNNNGHVRLNNNEKNQFSNGFNKEREELQLKLQEAEIHIAHLQTELQKQKDKLQNSQNKRKRLQAEVSLQLDDITKSHQRQIQQIEMKRNLEVNELREKLQQAQKAEIGILDATRDQLQKLQFLEEQIIRSDGSRQSINTQLIKRIEELEAKTAGVADFDNGQDIYFSPQNSTLGFSFEPDNSLQRLSSLRQRFQKTNHSNGQISKNLINMSLNKKSPISSPNNINNLNLKRSNSFSKINHSGKDSNLQRPYFAISPQTNIHLQPQKSSQFNSQKFQNTPAPYPETSEDLLQSIRQIQNSNNEIMSQTSAFRMKSALKSDQQFSQF